jgi:5-methylcytosine-specific restriction endonuclease McrA
LKTLLLDSSYQVLSFISEKKVMKLIVKDKVEIVEEWQNSFITWSSGKIKHPSVVRLKKHVRRNYFNSNFSRKALIKRDRSVCQYCCRKLTASQITIDHVLPRAQGGITSFTNTVVACTPCNNLKADKTPEQANMKLLRKPTHPSFSMHHYASDQQENWNFAWDDYLKQN